MSDKLYRDYKAYIEFAFMCDLSNLGYYLHMESKDLFNILHNAVEAQQYGKKISQKSMAEKLGISMRTYQDWRLGNSQPQAATAIFRMLGELDEEDIVRIIKKISKGLKDDKNERS
jgi:DNA-binding XRE family transcriptional regulator